MKSAVIAFLAICIPFIMNAQECYWSYRFNPEDDSAYTMSCGEITESGVVVSRNSCNFYTALTSFSDSIISQKTWLKVSAEFNSSNNLEEEDFVWIFLYVNGETIKTITIKGKPLETLYHLTDSVLISPGNNFRMRIAIINDDENEFWNIADGKLNLCLTGKKKISNYDHEIKKRVIARKEREFVKLYWTTEPSSSPNYFKIERSIDGKNFAFTGFVKELKSTGETEYTFIDARPDRPKSWYRIKQVNDQGSETLIEAPVLIEYY